MGFCLVSSRVMFITHSNTYTFKHIHTHTHTYTHTHIHIHLHVFVADVIKSFDTVYRGILDRVLHQAQRMFGGIVVWVCRVGLGMLILSIILWLGCVPSRATHHTTYTTQHHNTQHHTETERHRDRDRQKQRERDREKRQKQRETERDRERGTRQDKKRQDKTRKEKTRQ